MRERITNSVAAAKELKPPSQDLSGELLHKLGGDLEPQVHGKASNLAWEQRDKHHRERIGQLEALNADLVAEVRQMRKDKALLEQEVLALQDTVRSMDEPLDIATQVRNAFFKNHGQSDKKDTPKSFAGGLVDLLKIKDKGDMLQPGAITVGLHAGGEALDVNDINDPTGESFQDSAGDIVGDLEPLDLGVRALKIMEGDVLTPGRQTLVKDHSESRDSYSHASALIRHPQSDELRDSLTLPHPDYVKLKRAPLPVRSDSSLSGRRRSSGNFVSGSRLSLSLGSIEAIPGLASMTSENAQSNRILDDRQKQVQDVLHKQFGGSLMASKDQKPIQKSPSVLSPDKDLSQPKSSEKDNQSQPYRAEAKLQQLLSSEDIPLNLNNPDNPKNPDNMEKPNEPNIPPLSATIPVKTAGSETSPEPGDKTETLGGKSESVLKKGNQMVLNIDPNALGPNPPMHIHAFTSLWSLFETVFYPYRVSLCFVRVIAFYLYCVYREGWRSHCCASPSVDG